MEKESWEIKLQSFGLLEGTGSAYSAQQVEENQGQGKKR